jgi:hypothetical protein
MGCLVQCYAGVVRFCGMLICSLYPNGRTLCDVYEQDSKRENNGQLCTVASRNGDV